MLTTLCCLLANGPSRVERATGVWKFRGMEKFTPRTKVLVLEKTGSKQFTLWQYKAEDQGLIRVTTDAPLVVGKWFIHDKDDFLELPSQPETVSMSRNNTNLIRVQTIVVRPLPSYFDSDEGIAQKRFMKHFAVSSDFGVIFVNGALLQTMDEGVPYQMFVASYGMTKCMPQDKVLKSMKAMGTIWLASKQDLIHPTIKETGMTFAARMRTMGVILLDIPGKEEVDPVTAVESITSSRKGPSFGESLVSSSSSAGRGFHTAYSSDEGRSTTTVRYTMEEIIAAQTEEIVGAAGEVQHKVTVVENELEMWSDVADRRERLGEKYRHFDYASAEGKAKTRAVLEKVLANHKICKLLKNVVVEEGKPNPLEALKKIMPPTTTTTTPRRLPE